MEKKRTFGQDSNNPLTPAQPDDSQQQQIVKTSTTFRLNEKLLKGKSRQFRCIDEAGSVSKIALHR